MWGVIKLTGSGVMKKDGRPGIILGRVNDGVAGVLRLTVKNEAGQVLSSGCLDPGYPKPGKVRQAQLVFSTDQLRMNRRSFHSLRRFCIAPIQTKKSLISLLSRT